MDFERAFMSYAPFGDVEPGQDGPYDFEAEITRCEHCGAEVDHPIPGYVDLCDPCAVRNAEDCGDWDEPAIAAFRRLNPDPATC